MADHYKWLTKAYLLVNIKNGEIIFGQNHDHDHLTSESQPLISSERWYHFFDQSALMGLMLMQWCNLKYRGLLV